MKTGDYMIHVSEHSDLAPTRITCFAAFVWWLDNAWNLPDYSFLPGLHHEWQKL